MHAMKFLSALAFASSVSASLFNGAHARGEVLQFRAPSASTNATNSTNSASACASIAKELATLIQSIPEPTGSLASFLATAYSTVTNPCAVTIPTPLSSAYVVYGSSILSFFSVNEAQIESAIAICPAVTSVAAFPICPTLLAGPASATVTAASATPTVTASKSSTASPTSSTPAAVTGGARDPRDSGLLVAALAAGGMVVAMGVAL